MKLLVTGANGRLGSHITGPLAETGLSLRLLDQSPVQCVPEGAEVWKGRLEDPDGLRRAMRGADAVLHLAWSFQSDLKTLLEIDLAGQLLLQEAAAAAGVNKLILSSSCVVYGQPRQVPVPESHVCKPETGRAPAYGAAKLAAETFLRAFSADYDLKHTIFRFWWGFGQRLGGKALRAMIDEACNQGVIRVPQDRGGHFLYFGDFATAVLAALADARTDDQTFNLGTLYCRWADVAQMIWQALGESGRVEEVPVAQWKGPGYLADDWRLDLQRFQDLGGQPARSGRQARDLLQAAISHTVNQYLNS